MTLAKIQKQVHEWASQYEVPYWEPQFQALRLTEEVGELAREINHLYGPKPKKPTEDTKELGGELGDILFTVICISNAQEIDLDEAWKATMDKYYTRDKDRYARK
jgi:NTP pyrophosphatase (non-canonical NTP hydrolase)